MGARRIVVNLTDEQYDALVGAVAQRDAILEQDGSGPADRGERVALNNGFDRLRSAWQKADPYPGGRPGRPNER